MARRTSTRKAKRGTAAHEQRMQHDLDRYGLKLIKVIGVVGAVMGLMILVAFWYWLLAKLFAF